MEQETKVRWGVGQDCVYETEQCTYSTRLPFCVWYLDSFCLEFNVELTLYTMTVLNGNIARHVPQNITDGY